MYFTYIYINEWMPLDGILSMDEMEFPVILLDDKKKKHK